MPDNRNPEPDSGVQRVVLVVPEAPLPDRTASDMNFYEVWQTIWRGKLVISIIGAASLAISITYVLLAEKWYTAEVVLAPAEESTGDGLTGQLGGLAGLVGLAGISVGGGNAAEPLAVLRSRRLLSAFINDHQLLPTLFLE